MEDQTRRPKGSTKLIEVSAPEPEKTSLLGRFNAFLNRTAASPETFSENLKKQRKPEIDRGAKDLAAMQRFFRATSMNPKGFRTPSKKHGPRGPLTAPDHLLLRVVGYENAPKGTQSDRKKRKAERRVDYLTAVKANPQYPDGDRRTRA